MSKWIEWVKTLDPKIGKSLCKRWERHATLIDIYVVNYRDRLLHVNAELIEEESLILGENRCIKEIESKVSHYKNTLEIMVERDRSEMVNYINRNK
jgi:hypothetical protein